MTMEGPIPAGELEGQARIRHADALDLVSGVLKAVIEEAWEVYEKARAAAQSRYEEESAELQEFLDKELEAIASGEGDPGPVPEVEPATEEEPVQVAASAWTITDSEGPVTGVDPGEVPPDSDQVYLGDILSWLTTIGHDLARSPGEEKVIADGLEALREVIEAEGDAIKSRLDVVITLQQTNGGDHEIDQSS